MFYELLGQGKIITVEPGKDKKNKDFTVSTFTMQNGKVIAENSALGKFVHQRFTNSPDAFNLHIAHMITENFRIVID